MPIGIGPLPARAARPQLLLIGQHLRAAAAARTSMGERASPAAWPGLPPQARLVGRAGRPLDLEKASNRLTDHVFPLADVRSQDNYISVSIPFVRGADGTVWFGTYGAVIGNNGIGVFHYDGDTTDYFSAARGLLSENSKLTGGYHSPPNSLKHIFAIGEDLQGNCTLPWTTRVWWRSTGIPSCGSARAMR